MASERERAVKRRVGMGLLFYQQDYDGWYPDGGSNPPPPSWWETIGPYVGIEDLSDHYTDPDIVYYCPTAGAAGWTPWTYNHYAYNLVLSPYYFLPVSEGGGGYSQWMAVGKPDRIAHPDEVVLIAEAMGIWYFSMGSLLPENYFDPRHTSGVGNVMFTDQHVEELKVFYSADLDPAQRPVSKFSAAWRFSTTTCSACAFQYP